MKQQKDEQMKVELHRSRPVSRSRSDLVDNCFYYLSTESKPLSSESELLHEAIYVHKDGTVNFTTGWEIEMDIKDAPGAWVTAEEAKASALENGFELIDKTVPDRRALNDAHTLHANGVMTKTVELHKHVFFCPRPDLPVHFYYLTDADHPYMYVHKDGTVNQCTGWKYGTNIDDAPGAWATAGKAKDSAISNGFEVIDRTYE